MVDKNKTYIEDLQADNNKLFAFNHDIQEKRKELKKRLCDLCDGYGSIEDMKQAGALVGRLLGMAMIYRQNIKDIKKNMALIRGLRDGSITEI